MVVLHGSWLEGALHLWAEHWPADSAPSARHSIGSVTPPLSPFSLTADELRAALMQVPDATTGPGEVACVAWLPTLHNRPIHSREVWRHLSGRARGESGHSPVLQAWQVIALPLSWRAVFAVLGACCREDRRLAPGIIAGADLPAWADLFRYAGAFVARKAFLPALARTKAGFESRWQPVLDGADRIRLARFASRLPAATRSLEAVAGWTAPAAPPVLPPATREAENFVLEAVDRLVRLSTVTTLTRAHAVKGRYCSAHDAWLASLRGDERTIRWDDVAELEVLDQEIHAWRRPIDLASRASWRLQFQLEEPAASDSAGATWFLRYLAQPFDRPEAALPLSSPELATEDGVELALCSLGQAAALCPLIGRGVEPRALSGCCLTTAEAHEFLTRFAPLLAAAGFGVVVPAWWRSENRRPRIELIARAAPGTASAPGALPACALAALVSVDWQVALGGEAVTVSELEELAQSGANLVRFRDRWMEVDGREAEEALRLWRRHRSEERSAGDIVRMMVGVDQEAHGIRVGGVEALGWVQDLAQRLSGSSAREDVPAPAGFQGELRPYQRRGYAWLAFLRQWGLGACLADDMGLGKTIQALALLMRERENGEKRPVLLICPTSVIGNWQHETARFTPGLSVMRHHGPDRCLGESFVEEAARHALVVTSYALLPRDYATLRRVSWAGVLLDEAQNVKNPDTRQAQAARALTADYRMALTGTPIENHVGDLWSIMDFLNPGLLGTRASFRDRFLRPIQSGIDPTARERLRRASGPFILRRVKTDREVIADLPEKVEGKVFCPLTREQARLYATVLNGLSEALEDASGIARRGLVLAALTHLKQICNHPANYLKDDSGELAGRSGKLDRLGEMIEESIESGDRALIFTQFAEMGFLLQRHLGQLFGFDPPFLHGGVPARTRDQMVAAFQTADGPPVFVLSLRAGGTGLNLTAANHVFHFDRWWNPAVENQATDRAFRIGQTRAVMVHKFICAGTMEDRIDAMIAAKTAIAESVVGSGERWLTELSDDELKSTLALAPEAVLDDLEDGKQP